MRKVFFVIIIIILFSCSARTQYLYFSKTHNTITILTSEPAKPETITYNSTNLIETSVEVNSNHEVINENKNYSNQAIREKEDLPNPINRNIVEDRPLFSKEVFLTFDDGPSSNTSNILKILKNNNVKATFFVIGSGVDQNPEVVKAEYAAGMCILNHSYSHNYSMYRSVEATNADFNKCNTAIKKAIGIDPLSYIRFPGGSDNKVSNSQTMNNIRNEVVSMGLEYIDWNTYSGDADKISVSANTLEHNLISQFSVTNFAVTLMHDAPGKETTVEALPIIIDYLKKQGFIFRTFADLTPTEEKEMKKDRIIDRGLNK